MWKRRKRLSRLEMLDSVPRLNPAVRWNALDTGQTLAVYRKRPFGPVGWLRGLFAVPEVAELLLDDVGARVVRQIDGRRPIRDVIAYVGEEFRLSRRESEVALLKYMEMLGRRNLVGFEVRATRKAN